MRIITPELVTDKVVAVRLDLNVPLKDGKIIEDTRILKSIPTLKLLLQGNPKRIHILTHLGRPKGEQIQKLSTEILVKPLSEALNQTVEFRSDYNPSEAQIQLHQNVRFYDGETKNNPKVIAELQKIGADIFINDAFGTSHRAHASVVGLANSIPAYGGPLIEAEIKYLEPLLSNTKQDGLTVIIGGAKIETKVGVLKHFATTAQNVLIGGALANTFLYAQGYDVGNSLFEADKMDLTQEIMASMDNHQTGFHIPIDVTCAESYKDTQSLTLPLEDVMGNLQILDLGRHTIESYAEIIMSSKTIIWNGPMGVFENPAFASGTKLLLQALQKSPATTIIGGGESLAALKHFGINQDEFSHVSTGGGAMLDYLSGKELPGLEILK